MKKRTWVMAVFLAAFGTLQAFAGQYDLKEMTAEVKQALAGRQQRYDELQQLKASGQVGENNQGYVEALKGGGSIVTAENQDRRVIYNAIVSQNQFGPGGIAQVQKAFAEVQRDKARPGDYVQGASGEWKQK
jgi:uncharacterized protein YdbL (DUF1318 family)